MSGSIFEQKIEEGFYTIGRQRDQLAFEKRKLARQLRFTQHAARLTGISKQYDFAMVFFATLGAMSLILSNVNSHADAWLFTTLGFPLMLLAGAIALKGRKIVQRITTFHNRFGSWQFG
jgi:hypothetical protein